MDEEGDDEEEQDHDELEGSGEAAEIPQPD